MNGLVVEIIGIDDKLQIMDRDNFILSLSFLNNADERNLISCLKRLL
jgi:hypothetical protein